MDNSYYKAKGEYLVSKYYTDFFLVEEAIINYIILRFYSIIFK